MDSETDVALDALNIMLNCVASNKNVSVPLCVVASIRSVHPSCRETISCENLFQIFMAKFATGQDVLPALRSICWILSSSPGQRLSPYFISHCPKLSYMVNAQRGVSEPFSLCESYIGAALRQNTKLRRILDALIHRESADSDVALTMFFMHDDFERITNHVMENNNYADRTWRRLCSACTLFDETFSVNMEVATIFVHHAGCARPDNSWLYYIQDLLPALRLNENQQDAEFNPDTYDDILKVLSFVVHFQLKELSLTCCDAKSVCSMLRRSLWRFLQNDLATSDQLRELALFAYRLDEPYLSSRCFEKANHLAHVRLD